MANAFHRFAEVDDLLRKALDQPPERRADFLKQSSAGDPELRHQVERLLDSGELDPLFEEGVMPQLLEATSLVGTVLGHYRIDGVLGRGGMGQVFRAHDPRLNRDVALKVVSEAEYGASHLDRLEREARNTSALNHPNIVTVYDIGREEGLAYIAMELVDGESLAERLERGRLKLQEALEIATQVAGGMAAAHSKGILHRDLKPGNIMVNREGTAKIVDFGLAKSSPLFDEDDETRPIEPDSITAHGAIVGTVAYMSPEQASGKRVDVRSDQFSFGTVLYELVTGDRPFSADSAVETLAAIISHPPVPPDERDSSIPATVVHVLERCLAKSPDERYQSSTDLALDLAAVRDGASSPTGLPGRPASRKAAEGDSRRWIGLAAALVLLSLAALVAWKTLDGPSQEELVAEETAEPVPSSVGPAMDSGPAAIAVLPFENRSDDPEGQYLAEGVSEDLITRLMSWRSFPVISQFSSFAHGSQPANLEGFAKDLGVRYVVQGSVRRDAETVRIGASLLDAQTGEVVWREQFDRAFQDIFALQEEISRQIVGQMLPELERREQARALSQPTDNLDAWTWAQRGWHHWALGNLEDLEVAAQAFEKAMELEGGFSDAYAGRALVYYFNFFLGHSSIDEVSDGLMQTAKRAVFLDEKSANAQHALAHAYAVAGEREQMLAAYRRSVDLNPGSALTLACAGEGMALAGEHEQALEWLEQALVLSPKDPALSFTLHSVALTHFAAGRYQDAVDWSERALEVQPTLAFAYRTAAASLALLGRIEEAKATYQEAADLEPEFTLVGGFRLLLTADPAIGERYLEGLRLAGLPKDEVDPLL